MSSRNLQEIERKIADLKGRWPKHSVPPNMWQELEELEAQLEAAKQEEEGSRQNANGK
jgi:hypothetical protein